MWKLFKRTPTSDELLTDMLERKDELSDTEKLEAAASLMGVAPSYLEKRLSDKPISNREAARQIGLEDWAVGAAKKMQYTSKTTFAMDVLDITEEELNKLKARKGQTKVDEIVVTKVENPSFDQFLRKVREAYEPEDGWKDRNYEHFFNRIHKFSNLSNIKDKSILTPRLIIEMAVDIIINAYKASYTANYGTSKLKSKN